MKKIRTYLGAILGGLTLLIFQILKLFPTVVETIYTNQLYRFIRFVYGISFAYIPFPIIYLFILGVLFLILRQIFRKKRKRWIAFTINLAGWTVFLFYILWGFNYARGNFAERQDISVLLPEQDFLYQELIAVDSSLAAIRKRLQTSDTIALDSDLLPSNLEEIIRDAQVRVLNHWGEPIFSKPRIRSLKPKGSLLRLKTAGVYFPFVMEGHIDDGLHPIEKPYVMAHEMAHAYAITDEGVCNFVGFITCVNSSNLFVQYSGWLEYQGYLYRALRRNFPEKLEAEAYRLPKFIVTDLIAIRERLEMYPNIAPWLRDLFYNNYLKAQGIKDGMKSYSQITRLAYSYKKKNGDFKL